MPRSIVGALKSLMSDEIIVEPLLSKDAFGEEDYGAAQTIQCRIRNGHRIVRDRTGQEVTSSVQVWLAGTFEFTADARFTLPDRFKPQQPVAISYMQLTDENTGGHHDMVAFK